MEPEIARGAEAPRPTIEPETDLHDYIENAPVALHWVGEDGTILWANKAELEMLGYTRAEYIGRNILQFHVDELVIVDMLERLKSHEELRNYEATLRCRDGSTKHVLIDSNVFHKNGDFIHTRCVTRDISVERGAAVLQERLAAIVESSDDAIISKDLGGFIRSWNQGAQRIFGYTAEETVGRHVSMLAAPDRVDEIPKILRRIARGERVDHYRTERKTKDGRILSVSLTVSPIRDASGRIIGASKVARDVTAQTRHEDALRTANELLRRSNADLEHFAYSASHDLQEPLRMVASFGDLLKMKVGGQIGPEADAYIQQIVSGALRMEQLLHDLRAYVRVSALTPEPEHDTDANIALEHVLANLTAAIDESGAKITHTALPSVRVHKFQLQQLFQNLIANAIRYRSADPPQIHIAAELRGSEWLFSVRDNGIGIEEQYREQIFGIFKRLHTNSDHPGTGMGLAICERIVIRAGGRIWVESVPGGGSTFFFTIAVNRNQ